MTVPGVVVYLAGTRWDGIEGTDRRLASALGSIAPVLWIDPPFSILTRKRGCGTETNRAGSSLVAPGVTRLQVLSPPGSSRFGIRWLSSKILAGRIRAWIRSAKLEVCAVVLASPREHFPHGVPGVRVLYVTDDWSAGATMMGLRSGRVTADLERSVRRADVVAAVSPDLAESLGQTHAITVEILPNGCSPLPDDALHSPSGEAIAGLVGQLNERLDPAILEAVRAGGTPLVVVGPRTDRDAVTRLELDRLLGAGGVTWHDEVPVDELPAHLARMGVGLTPYADTPFNRASFPLKILEYLAAGLPVVSTDLPAVRWLDTDLIEIGRDPQEFACRVREVLARPVDPADRVRRIAFARGHSWRARASQLMAIVGEADPRHRDPVTGASQEE